MNMFAVAIPRMNPMICMRPPSPACPLLKSTIPVPGSPFAVATNRVKPCWLLRPHASATTEMMTYLRLRSQSPANCSVLSKERIAGLTFNREKTK